MYIIQKTATEQDLNDAFVCTNKVAYALPKFWSKREEHMLWLWYTYYLHYTPSSFFFKSKTTENSDS